MRRVLVVANDHVGRSMAGPGIRSYRLAGELASHYDVTLAVPYRSDAEAVDFALTEENVWSATRMTRLVSRFDAVVTQRLPVPTMLALRGSSTRVIYDLYAPWPIEALAFEARQARTNAATAAYRLNVFSQEVALATGDAFICASERQRDLWLGALLAAGRVDHAEYARDPSLRWLVDVVPHGADGAPPRPGSVLRGVVPGIGADDRVALWPGGVWNWLDPLTVIRAVDRLLQTHGDIRLYFLGLAHPNADVPEMEMAGRAIALADELGLRDRAVFFNRGWVPYEERGAYLLEADVGVSAHFDDLEARFAFRARLVDCFWAGLPVVTSEGDALGDMVAQRGLGATVPVGNVEGWQRALGSLLYGPRDETLQERLRGAAADLAWPRAVEPLRRLIDAEPTGGRRGSGRAYLPRYAALRARHTLAERGTLGAASRALELLSRTPTRRSRN